MLCSSDAFANSSAIKLKHFDQNARERCRPRTRSFPTVKSKSLEHLPPRLDDKNPDQEQSSPIADSVSRKIKNEEGEEVLQSARFFCVCVCVSRSFRTLSGEALDFVVLPTHGTDTQVRGGVEHWPEFRSVRRRKRKSRRRRSRRRRRRSRGNKRTRGDPSAHRRGKL